MNVLVVGSGGREHAIAWKLAQSKKVEKIFIAPGNAGTASIGENVNVAVNDFNALADFAQANKIDLTVVGPEEPLVNGIVDFFEARGLVAFGPSKNAAILEGSKLFCRQLLQKYKIPSAEFKSFSDAAAARAFVQEKGAPIVVKADGLAAGKGVFVCNDIEEAESAIGKILVEKIFGAAGSTVIIEETLKGEEASFLVFSDAKSFKVLPTSQDHKRAFDNDAGPNTGGMGAYSPAPVVTEELQQEIEEKIIQPTIDAMRKEDRDYKGVLYAGLMITKDGPKVLEFNCRFGDPETQVILPRLESDIVPIMQSCIEGSLAEQKMRLSNNSCCCVAMASGGYPGAYEKGKEILGLEKAAKLQNTIVFHAGTRLEAGKVLTNGGRVLGVTALGNNIKRSIDNAYNAVRLIKFEKAHYRTDIGKRALERKP